MYGTNGIISTTQDVVTLTNIKKLEESIDLYKTEKYMESKTGLEAYPIAKNDDGSYITLAQAKTEEELSKLSDDIKYILLNLSSTKGTTDIPTLNDLDYTKFYKLDASKLGISEEGNENLIIYIEGDTYKVIDIAGIKLQGETINVIIPLKNEAKPEYITVANNTYKLYGDGTVKVLGEKTVNSGYTSSEINSINNSLDEFDIEKINNYFGNPISLPAQKIYFSTGTVYIIDSNNDLWAWGANDFNKLGLGHSYLITEPTKILEGRCDSTKVSKVWAGATNTFIVDLEGKVYGCGTNATGELGIGKDMTTDKYVQIQMPNELTGNNIEYMSLSEDVRFGDTIIKFDNGQVWGMGYNYPGILGTGNSSHIYTLTELTQFYNCKYIETNGLNTIIIDSENNLYTCGHFYNPNLERILTPLKIEENVKEVTNWLDHRITGITLNGEVFIYYNTLSDPKIIIENDSNATILSYYAILSNNKIYNISGSDISEIFTDMQSPEKYFENEYQNGENKNMLVIKNDGKIYVHGKPDITKVKEKSNYNLKTVFENAIFVQGKGNNINIVDRNGNVYENLTTNSNISNVRKIIASARQKYIITEDNHLYAKGYADGSIWGEHKTINDYVEIQKENGEKFNNVKNIYTSSLGYSVIIQTEDNKLYWGGNVGYITLPGISGDYQIANGNYVTNYPKEITSSILDEIKNKIKDIQYYHDPSNSANLYKCNMLILTEDGKLYTRSMNKVTSGNNTQVGRTTGDFSELIIKEGTIVENIATEDGLSLAILSNGEVYGWGYNLYGILGPEYTLGEEYPTPVKLALPNNIEYMSLGNGYAIFISKTGEVYGIGKNDYGQLGTGDSIGRSEFVRCPELEK